MSRAGILLGGLMFGWALIAPAQAAVRQAVPGFRTIQLTNEFHAESAALADLDNDGDPDVIYGPFWFEGPDFKKRHLIYEPRPFATAVYSNNFFVYAEDLDGDGWRDLLVLGFPGRKASAYWFKNPGRGAGDSLWQRFAVFNAVGNESPVWGDVNGDGQKEILCSVGGRFGLVAPSDRSQPELPWEFTPISPPRSTGNHFTHGSGFGDVNGDGRNDVLEKSGWWEQPEADASASPWKKHPYPFADGRGGSQMFTYDFDADGDNDVISATDAHGYGLAWFEQVKKAGGLIDFVRHQIMGEKPEESRHGVAFSQLHGLRLADVDADGVLDIVTGKRYFAHRGKDPGGRDAPVIYWFRTVREPGAEVGFVPHLIHDASGVGVDVITGDANADGKLDIVVGNKKGCFIHFQTIGNEISQTTATPAPAPSLHVTTRILEGESLKVLKKSGSVRPQTVRRRGQSKWSGDAQLFWISAKPGDVIELAVPVRQAGSYNLDAGLTKANDYGIFEFALDGRKLAEPFDLYNESVTHTGPVPLARGLKLTAGDHTLSVTLKGANSKAVKKYRFGLDYVSLQGESTDQSSTLPAAPRRSQPTATPRKGKKRRAQKVKVGNDLEAEARTAAEQQARFVLPEGFVIELVASEETGVPKPTSLTFDDAGRLWATTAVEYPRDRDPAIWKKPGRDRVVVIDTPHAKGLPPVRSFAEGMVMPMSVQPHGDGAFVAQGPEILFLTDSDADGKADQRTVLIKGFGVQDTHTLPHQLARMPGGRIVFSQGVLNSGTIMDAAGRSHSFDKTLIASMKPDGTDLRIIGAGLNNIWAWAHDRLGRVFIHEANDLGYGLVPFEEDSSYPSFVMSKLHPDAPFHPATAEGLNLGGTGFSGIARCEDRSGSFPAPWRGRFFVANPITGQINTAAGSQGSDGVWKFEKHAELVTCDDPMFRPVSIAFGPDGCLYIADWCNRIISHNEVARDHPARDKIHGRIWRVRHTGQAAATITDFTKAPTAELPGALTSDSVWAMRAAWHQIAQRQDRSVIPGLNALIRNAKVPVDARIHALWSLEELGHFDTGLWRLLLTQPSSDLRREAVRALQSLRVPQSAAGPLLRTLADETDWSVRYEILRYFRRAEGPVSPENLAWLRLWSAPKAPSTTIDGYRQKYLALDGSYQRAFQDFLLKLAETKTQLPVFTSSKWSRVIETKKRTVDPRAVADRIAAIKSKLAKSDMEQGRLVVQGMCLTCHSIAGQGIGFAPPLDGSRNRDLDGMITAIIDPNAAIENIFRAYRIENKNGTIHEGFRQGESRSTITLSLMGGVTQTVPTKQIKSAGYIEGKSVMPELTEGMDPELVAAIVAYLQTVK